MTSLCDPFSWSSSAADWHRRRCRFGVALAAPAHGQSSAYWRRSCTTWLSTAMPAAAPPSSSSCGRVACRRVSSRRAACVKPQCAARGL
eukprot:CAMPEP_0119465928 /NCGR_PEP_ID=MMETSP1344-20130328/824_1 /TAXON_ID=236787 /ORGANISM="Florenciella parvula, Strain CCMP2471" /LENGTH=88 /DNA_ID=CAMNT_0007498215 /DNA_START=1088 /DNA_END=1351 /DNA_ORIENTATION=-